MTVLEGMSVGRPVLVADSCGLASAVIEHDCGVVVDESLEGLVDGLREMLSDREALVRQGRERARGRARRVRHGHGCSTDLEAQLHVGCSLVRLGTAPELRLGCMSVVPGDGHRDRVRRLRARPARSQRDGRRRQVVNGYAAAEPAARPPPPLGLRGGEPAARRARVRGRLGARDHLAGSPTTTLGLANVILTNGARLYVDHAHPEYSTPEVHQPARRRPLGQGGGAGHGARRRARPARCPGTAPIQLYKNNTDGKGASYGTHENYLMARPTPFAEIVRHLTPFFVSRQVVCGRRAGRDRAGRPRRGLPAHAARRLLRGRGGPRDHAEAADHQHPRRAARRPGEVPPAARDHRRRQPVRGRDLPQGRDDGARAGDDRGALVRRQRHRPRRSTGRSRRCARSRTTRRCATGDPARRPQDDRGAAADGVLRAGAQVRRGPAGRRRRRRRPLDVLARWESVLDRLETDPMSLAGELDWVAKLALLRGLPRPRGPGLGRRRSCTWSTCSTATSALDKGLYNRLVARGRMETLVTEAEVQRAVAGAAGGHPRVLPRALPGAVPDRRSRPPRGTRSSSTSAASRCSGCRRSSRCAGRRRTSATCSTTATRAARARRDARRPR